jgi:hypothetical protein
MLIMEVHFVFFALESFLARAGGAVGAVSF